MIAQREGQIPESLYNYFWPHVVLRPGIELMPPAVEAWSLNHWTSGKPPWLRVFKISSASTGLVLHLHLP